MKAIHNRYVLITILKDPAWKLKIVSTEIFEKLDTVIT